MRSYGFGTRLTGWVWFNPMGFEVEWPEWLWRLWAGNRGV